MTISLKHILYQTKIIRVMEEEINELDERINVKD